MAAWLLAALLLQVGAGMPEVPIEGPIGWAVDRALYDAKDMVQENVLRWPEDKCTNDADMYDKSIQKMLPKEFHQKWRPAKVSSFIQEGEEVKPQYVIPEFKWLDNPFGNHIHKQIFVATAKLGEPVAPTVDTPMISTDKFEAWYVNMDKETSRAKCTSRQLKEVNPKGVPRRFSALVFPDKCTTAQANPEECLKAEGFGDCVDHGVDYDGINTHGSKSGGSRRKMAYRVVSNWCGHKRLFKQLEQSNSTADYFIVLEDDVIMDRKWFMPVIQDFVTNYKGQEWDLLQIDPFGAKSKDDLVDHFQGKPVWKPTYLMDISKPERGADRCRQYWGFQAAVIKKSALPLINEWISKQKAMPMDWVPSRLPRSLSYGGLIARNPEERVYGRSIMVPSFCSEEVLASTIAKGTSFQQSSSSLIEGQDKELQTLAAVPARNFNVRVEQAETDAQKAQEAQEEVAQTYRKKAQKMKLTARKVKSEVEQSVATLEKQVQDLNKQLQTVELQLNDPSLKRQKDLAQKELQILQKNADDSDEAAPQEFAGASYSSQMLEAQKKASSLNMAYRALEDDKERLEAGVAQKFKELEQEKLKFGAVEFSASKLTQDAEQKAQKAEEAATQVKKPDYAGITMTEDSSSLIEESAVPVHLKKKTKKTTKKGLQLKAKKAAAKAGVTDMTGARLQAQQMNWAKNHPDQILATLMNGVPLGGFTTG